jgi:putative toxin-antitoxin system antitoxin component (TIGR02293 family)
MAWRGIIMARYETAEETADLATYCAMVREQTAGAHAYATLLGLGSPETTRLLKQIEAGFSYRTFERFRRNIDLTTEELAKLVQVSLRTLARRRETGRLSAEESDRLLRVSRVFGKALALFEGDVEASRAWLARPAPALANRSPREIATTELGAREVENLIGRLEHGVYS